MPHDIPVNVGSHYVISDSQAPVSRRFSAQMPYPGAACWVQLGNDQYMSGEVLKNGHLELGTACLGLSSRWCDLVRCGVLA